jgi:pimeloyl-ACP methyl ester carboxylesterase
MKSSIVALCIHGLGACAAWWEPFMAPLRSVGVDPRPLELPSLQSLGGLAWVEEVLRQTPRQPTVLIGHSLGAGVAVTAACRHRYAGLVLLAMPPFHDDFVPRPPKGTGQVAEIVAQAGRFLAQAAARAATIDVPVVHIVGDNDPYVPQDQAGRLPFPLKVIPGATHDLSRSPEAIAAVVDFLARLS